MITSTEHDGRHEHGELLPRLLELDAVVHASFLDGAIARAVARAGGADRVRRVLDVGAGVGTGTVALAERLPDAEVVAIDIDERMLAGVRVRAESRGLADRITTMRADISGAALEPGAADLVWASAALHEVPDAARALRGIAGGLRPGGALVVMEMDAPPMLLPASYAAWEERLRGSGSIGSPEHPDWGEAFRAAGLEDVEVERLESDQVLPADGPAGEYALLELRRIGHAVMPALSPADRERLQVLAGDGPGGVRSLGELWLRGTRTLWTARGAR